MQLAHPENTDSLLGLAKISRTQGRPDEAIAKLKEVIKISPGTAGPMAYNQIGGIHLEKGRSQEAWKAFQAALKIDSKNAVAHYNLAVALIAAGKRDEAMKHLQLTLKFNPSALPAMVRLAECYLEKGNLRQAADLCERALAINPRHVETLGTLALLYRQQGKSEEAQAYYLKAVEELKRLLADNPNNQEIPSQLAKFRQMWRPSPLEAIQRYSDILAKEPDNALALRGRATELLHLGRHAESIADYEKALKLLPDDHQILNNLAWVLATSPEDKLRDGRRAVELVEKACRATDYKQAILLGTLAAAYAENGDFPKAIQWSTRAVKIANENNKQALAEKLASYKAGKPWRERLGKTP